MSPTRTRAPGIVGMGWEDFVDWFSRPDDPEQAAWRQGQHIAMIGPTGEGKTNLLCSFLPIRPHVLALDAKGGDRTLAKLKTKAGFSQQTTWPLSSKQWDQIERGEPLRLVVGKTLHQMEDMAANAKLLGAVIHDVFAQRGWTVAVDESQMTADRAFMNLGKPLELNMIAGRDRGISVVNLYQQPSWVPRTFSRQATWTVLYYTQDRDTATDLARMVGREPAQIWGAMSELEPYCVLVVKNNPREPLRITRAPRF